MDDKDGNKRYTTEIYGDNMTMLGGARREQGGMENSNQNKVAEPIDTPPAPEDDLPF